MNGRDEIVFLDENWERFALENDGEDLTPDRVLGHSIWKFVADPTTQSIYGQIFQMVRSGRSIQFTLRCDAPRRRRLLEMRLSGLPQGAIEIRTQTLESVERPFTPILSPTAERSDLMVSMCGWCNRVDVGSEQWAELDEAVRRLGIFDQSPVPLLSHGICPRCVAVMSATLDEPPAVP